MKRPLVVALALAVAIPVINLPAPTADAQVLAGRHAARQELESLRKDGDLSEDDLVRAEKELDKVTHAREAEIDKALDQKEQELLEV